MTNIKRNKAIIAIAISLVMVLSAMTIVVYAVPNLSSSAKSESFAASGTPWTYPTTTQQEPGYTGGTYTMAATTDVSYLNVYQATDVYSFALLNEIYDGASSLMPNETILPWLATGWTEYNLSAMSATNATGTFLGLTSNGNLTTYDPITGSYNPVAYVYQVKIRPGTQWTDYSSSSSTYVFSNKTVFNDGSGVSHSYTYRFPSMSMSTYYVQSADFILSWKILQSALDYSGSFVNVVNVVPVTNQTVDFYLSAQSATFVTYTLETPILPYHVWVSHDYSSSSGAWNYTASLPGSGSYNAWNMGYNPSTGTAPGLVGTGPYMFANNYGEPQGNWIFGQYWKEYVNPHYFVQYTSNLRQWTPKMYELYFPLYLSLSAAVTAVTLNQVDQIWGGVTPSFLPTLATSPNTYVYAKPTTGYAFMQLNSYNQSDSNQTTTKYGFTPSSIAPPLNITSVRQALQYAVNKVYLDSVIAQGYEIPGVSVIPNSDSFWQNHTLPTYPYNPAKAMQMLNNTPGITRINGEYYYHGKQFTINIQASPASEIPLYIEQLLTVAQEWNAIGVKTTVTQESFATLVANLILYGYQGVALGISGIVGDPTGDYFSFYNTSGYGTGFYLGPYSNITFGGVDLSGNQVTQLMNNLTNELNTNTNITQRVQISDEIQGIAATEATMINFGYGVDLFPMVTARFVNATNSTLSQGGYEYWNFLSMHLRTASVTPPSSTVTPIELSVGVVPSSRIYYNGEYGNITISVRNQFGSPVQGASLTIGANPTGALINITSLSGVTNAQGLYTVEFKVFDVQPLIYTSDYVSEINVSAAATLSGSSGPVVPGLGYSFIDVTPQPVAYKILKMPALSASTTSFQSVQLEIYNPVTGAPISGYSYTIQTNDGILAMSNSTNPSAHISQVAENFLSAATDAYAPNGNYNMTQLDGITPANGTFSFGVRVASGVNVSALGGSVESYIFLGNYFAGAPVVGESGYLSLGELTSSTNANGFGVQQPVELPVQVTAGTAQYNISLTTSSPYISTPNGTIEVTAKVTTLAGVPVQNFTVDIVSQNALGANRGYFYGSGTQIQYTNVNELFGSTFLPGIQVTTGANGTATVWFTDGLYKAIVNNGFFSGYAPESFTDQYLQPADMFQLSAVGMNYAVVADATVNSSAYVNNPAPSPVLSAHFGNSQSYNGFTALSANSTYTMFVNSTLVSPAGQYASNLAFNVTVSVGTLAATSGNTSSGGSMSITYVAPNVTVLTAVTLTISTGDPSTYTQTFYIVPEKVVTKTTTHTVYNNSTVTKYLNQIPGYVWALVGVFAVLFVIFAAIAAIEARKARSKSPPEQRPPSGT